LKNFTILFLSLYFLLTANLFSQGFTSVFSKNGTDVIAVGGDLIYRSVDGGATWNSTQVAGNSFYSVWVYNSKIWITNQNSDSVYTSTDNGVTWTYINVTGLSGVLGICFIDGNTGWVSGGSAIEKTTNGGANWSLQSVPAVDIYTSVKFANANTGVACGRGGVLIYTTNGGSTWLQAVDPYANKPQLISIDIKGTTAIATGADAYILKSINSGASWGLIDYKILTKSQVTGVSIINDSTFYSCGGGGFIRKSADGGNTFNYQINPMMANLSSIYFYDSQNGWAISSKNTAILRTSDGGNTWLLPTGTTVTYSWSVAGGSNGNIGNSLAINFKNKNVMYVVCGSSVYISPDLGDHWSQIATISINGNAHSFYVSPKDTNIFLASVGNAGGRVVKSTNHGATWTSVWGPGALSSYGMPIEMDPNHPDTVYLSPSGSVLLRSTNFGDTWSNWSTNTFFDPCDMVVMYSNSSLMYFGDQNSGGKFYKSTDGGINWILLFSAGGSEIPMIGANNLDFNRIFFTNYGGGGIWRSTNGGSNWAFAFPITGSWGADVAKDDPMVAAFGIFGENTIYFTTNGGDNFTGVSIGDNINFGLYFYDRGTLIAQQGGGIWKFHASYTVPLVNVHQISTGVPKEFGLMQNYPNPFNPKTVINYQLSVTGYVKLGVFDIRGQFIRYLVNQKQNAGTYQVDFDAADLPSGVYFYELTTEKFSAARKMILIK
jgi:photosystem II stability/assembly factor-like uncharacterized protein